MVAFRLELKDEELRLLCDRMTSAGQAERAAARLDYASDAANTTALDSWEDFAMVCIGIFERCGMVPQRKKCAECGLMIWPSEITDAAAAEICLNCADGGAHA